MKWGNGEKSMREAWSDGGVTAATAACAAQIPAAVMLSWALSFDNDNYGAPEGDFIGLACAFLFGPVLFPLIGLVHSVVLTLPAVSLGRMAAARSRDRGPGWAWTLAGLVPVALVWAVFFVALGGPYVDPALWIAVSGVLPALAVAYHRGYEARTGKPLRRRRMWFWSVPASIGLFGAALTFGFVATGTGLIKEYEPPQLASEQIVGVWRGGDGDAVELRLREDGRAQARGCPESATWTVDVDTDLDRPSVRIDVPSAADASDVDDAYEAACEGLQNWIIGGTEGDPELFVSEGDPDSPDIQILRRDR
ncbi:hypothetical protein AB0B50_40395 [Streptomyces sp. NPDC041068]|uniref:hypothetical protein n=1 Tax=Streptomyces sp. NPDC041068 TaxID=3155130 RepID=UPI0033E5B126